jgi:hypothetical protein
VHRNIIFASLIAAALWLPQLAYGQSAVQQQTFLQGIAQEESGGNSYIPNPGSTAIGQYQLTEAALEDSGFGTFPPNSITAADYNGNLSNFTWSGKDGVTSVASFEANQQAQTQAAMTFSQNLWSSLQNNGSTQYIGQTVNGQVLNQSAILDGSYVLGATGMHSYLVNGGKVLNKDGTENYALTQAVANRIALGSQLDSSAITGSDNQVPASATSPSPPGGVAGQATASLYCNPTVAKLLVQGSDQFINSEKSLATNPQTGYTLLNGNSVAQAAGLAPGGSSVGGGVGSFGQFSCLNNLLGGNLNVLFEPPNITNFINQLINSACSAAQGEISQMTQPITSALSNDTSLGGFFPGSMVANSLGGGLQTGLNTGGGNGFSFSLNGNQTSLLGGNGGSSNWYSAPAPAGQSFYNGLLGGVP